MSDPPSAADGRKDEAVEDRQAELAEQAKERAARRRRSKKEEREAKGLTSAPASSKARARTGGGFAGTAKHHASDDDDDELDESGTKRKKKVTALELQQRMHSRDQEQKDKAALMAIENAKSADLRAAELVQRFWRARQWRVYEKELKEWEEQEEYRKSRAGKSMPNGKPFKEKPVPPKGGPPPGSGDAKGSPRPGSGKAGSGGRRPGSGAAKSPKTEAEKEQERAAIQAQMKERAASKSPSSAAGKGSASYTSGLASKAQQKQTAADERDKAARIMIRFYQTFCRKRNARRAVKEEKRRRDEAAAKVQAAVRGKRIRQHIGYRGETEVETGRPHGFGRMVWPDGSSYEGSWLEGLMEGEGEITWSDGSGYHGEWLKGQRYGRGVYTNGNGDVHVGGWVDNVAEGQGTLTMLSGSVRDGVWRAGKLHGQGREVLRNDDGSEWHAEYEGGFVDGERAGPGTEISRDGTYEGGWQEGVRHGVGRFRDHHGWVYRGTWQSGRQQGTGVLSSFQGHRFSGTWQNGHLPEGSLTGRYLGNYTGAFKASGVPAWPLNRHGKGVWEGLHGERYEGQWREDYYDGIGVLKTKYAVYEGSFVHGKRHGHGVRVESNGDWYEGEWRHDQFDGDGERADKTGVYVGSFQNGKRHGHGQFTTYNGVRHIGEWKDGVREGEGEQFCPDGSRFVGTWSRDEKAGHGEFVDGFQSATGGEISYSGSYSGGIRHGDGAEWEGIYGDEYRGTFANGEMRGVGKFQFSDGEQYLGCWLAPGKPGQMPRRMSAVKRFGLGTGGKQGGSFWGKSGVGVIGGGDGRTGAGAEGAAASSAPLAATAAAAGSSDAAAEEEEEEAAATAPAARMPIEAMPQAVHDLKHALAQGGLEMLEARAASGGAWKAKRKGKKDARQDVRARMGVGGAAAGPSSSAAASQSAVSSGVGQRAIAAAATQKNPFAEAGSGVLMGGSATPVAPPPRGPSSRMLNVKARAGVPTASTPSPRRR